MDSTAATIGILLAGVVVVVGGVLLLRLHAFLALLLGALLVAALTPAATVERHALGRDAIRVLAVDEAGREVTLRLSEADGARVGMLYVVARRDTASGRHEVAGELVIERFAEEGVGDEARQVAVARLRGDPSGLPAGPDLVVQPHTLRGARRVAGENMAQRVATGFGNTCANIGILIAMAAIVGKCLLESGAADRIVRTMLRLMGEKRAPLAFLASSFTLAVPVFFDTVFYLMIPLGKAMGMRTGRNYLLYVLTIVAGGAIAHSLVPPTPGPLLVAELIGVSIGEMILGGALVGVVACTFGYFHALWANRRWNLPLRDTADLSLKDLEAISARKEEDLPPFWLSLLPIVLPVVLLGGYTMLDAFGWDPAPAVKTWAATLGDKNIALTLAAAIAMATLVWQKKTSRSELAESMQSALMGGGIIILITAAGGAFGGVLQQTGVSTLISELPRSSPVMIILLAWIITAAIRTAQGSATVAMITSAGILAGVASEGLGCHPVYLALAIGCGSKPIGWMNDSGFWVVTKMSGMTEVEGLKYVTPLISMMGVVGLIVILIAMTLFPMAP